jgi:hypothetical protein
MIRHAGGPMPSAIHQQALVVRPPKPVEARQLTRDDSRAQEGRHSSSWVATTLAVAEFNPVPGRAI